MLNFLLPLMSILPIESIYMNNVEIYHEILTSDRELTEHDRLHLLGLKLLIDTRRGCKRDLYIVSRDIFELIDKDTVLTEEFVRCYQRDTEK